MPPIFCTRLSERKALIAAQRPVAGAAFLLLSLLEAGSGFSESLFLKEFFATLLRKR